MHRLLSRMLAVAIVCLCVLVSMLVISGKMASAHPGGPGPDVPEEALPPGVTLTTVLTEGVDFPTALAAAPDGRLFFAEKGGFNNGDVDTYVRVIEGGKLRPEPWITVTVNTEQERGLDGLTIDPLFAQNSYVYLYMTTPSSSLSNQIVRYREDPATRTGRDPVVIFNVPITNGTIIHMGGGLHFGPDDMLYLSMGDNANSHWSQDLTMPQGKIHRMNRWGYPPADNPFFFDPNVPVKTIFAYGLRNSFDFDFDPVSGYMFASENGWNCDDELNRMISGGNYGWGMYPDGLCPYPDGGVLPLRQWTPTIAPTGVAFYDNPAIPSWQGSLFMCDYNHGALHRFTLDPSRTIVVSESILDIDVPCTLDLLVDRDGSLLFSTVGGIYRLAPNHSVNLDPSYKAAEPAAVEPGGELTFTIHVESLAESSPFTVTDALPPLFQPELDRLEATQGEVEVEQDGTILWWGTVSPTSTGDLIIPGLVSEETVSVTSILNTATIYSPYQIYLREAHAAILTPKILAPAIYR